MIEGTELDGRAFLHRQREYLQRLTTLRKAGLEIAHVLVLLRTWSQGAATHLQRAMPMPTAWAQTVDNAIADHVAGMLDSTLDSSQREQLFLKVRDGGLGLGSAAARGAAAWLGAWEGGLAEVARECGVTGMEDWHAQWPEWQAVAHRQERQFAEQAGKLPPTHRWTQLLHRGEEKRQRALASQAYAHRAAKLSAGLHDDEAVKIKLASGPEAGAWLATGTEEVPPLADRTMQLCLRRRLRVGVPCPGGERCHHRGARGTICGTACLVGSAVDGQDRPDGGRHAVTCPLGGGVMRRHAAVCDTLGQWLRERGHAVTREQVVTQWSSEEDKAILDIVSEGSSHGPQYVDVVITDSAVSGQGRLAMLQIRKRERGKHCRYPHAGLTAFALDTRGMWGQEARAFAAKTVAHLPPEDRVPVVRDLRVRIARALQGAVADQMASAAAPPALGAGPSRV
jgi:hypothetical protein